MSTQTAIATARPVHLRYDLAGLRELRANNWPHDFGRISISAADADGNSVCITTNGSGEGEFTSDGLQQTAGTCDFSLRGWSDRRARAELRRRYEEMMENRARDADLARFEQELNAELGPVED